MNGQGFKPIRDNVRIGITKRAPCISSPSRGAELSAGVYDFPFGKYVEFTLDERRSGKFAQKRNNPDVRNEYKIRVGRKVRFFKTSYETSPPPKAHNGQPAAEYDTQLFGGKRTYEEFDAFKQILADELGKVDLSRAFSSESLYILDAALKQLGIKLDQLKPLHVVNPFAGIKPDSHVTILPSPVR